MPTIAIIRTGTANVASVLAAVNRCASGAMMTAEASVVENADYLVVPGVGSFGSLMRTLSANDLVSPIRDRLLAGRPTLAICLGLQILASSSDESPGVDGLGLIPDHIARFPTTALRVPHLGWNWVQCADHQSLIKSGYAYFANSYRLMHPPLGWCASVSDYAGAFVAAVQRGPILACQFHPELSGSWGTDLITRWFGSATTEAVPC